MNAPHFDVFNPDLGEREAQFALDAVRSRYISGSGGPFIERFEQAFAEFCGAKHGIAVTSGTTALHLACVLAGIGPGDEVIVPASTNIATALGVVQCGGTVVPVDVLPDTWCLDTDLLEAAITPRTRAIIPVHLFGHPVDMRPVWEVASRHGLVIIEDAAEAHGAMYEDRRVGALSDVGCFSFYANKVITTGEGGMLVTNRDDYAERARSLRNLAFGTPRFLHHERGFNYRMTNVQAAIGCAQMERIEEIITAKRGIAEAYLHRLAGIPGVQLPVEREWAQNIYWMFGIVVAPQQYGMTRDALMDYLLGVGIETRTMFCSMNLQPALIDSLTVRTRPCPVAEGLWARGLYLPSSPQLTDDQLDYICAAVREVGER